MVSIRKTTGADGKGIVCYLPDSLMQNTLADGAEYFQPH